MPRLIPALVAALAAGALFAPTAGAEIVGATETEQLIAGIPQNGQTLGRNRAPLTLTYFHELKCPFCREFSTAVLPKAIRRYVRSGKLKIVAQPVAFIGPDDAADSRRAAKAALALGLQRKYWNFMDLFYRNQQDEMTTYVTDAYLAELTAAIPGADAARMALDVKTKRVNTLLNKSETRWERQGEFGGLGVPNLYLTKTGRRLTGFDGISHLEPGFSRSLRREVNRLSRR